MESFKYLLVIGGAGVLGSAIIKVFKNNTTSWKICAIDFSENNLADKNIIIDKDVKFNEDLVKKLYTDIESFTKTFHAIFHVAGGWIKGSVKNIEVFTETEQMFDKNYYSCLLGKINIDSLA